MGRHDHHTAKGRHDHHTAKGRHDHHTAKGRRDHHTAVTSDDYSWMTIVQYMLNATEYMLMNHGTIVMV